MPLPFILAGVAIAAAGYGVKKGVDAKDDLDKAEKYSKDADKLAADFSKDLDSQKKATSYELESYGRLKNDAIRTVVDFQALFSVSDDSTIKNDFKDAKRIVITKEEEIGILKCIGVLDADLSMTAAENIINSTNLELNQIGSGLASVAAGSLAGIAAGGSAYLGVGSLATASTGTAIGGLSGAAATNATLAWLGGGSLASGGLGMAGGAMVLGGLVVGPLLAIGGAVFAKKAAGSKDSAKEHYSYVCQEVNKGKIVISKLNAIEKHTELCDSVCYTVLDGLKGLMEVLSQYAQNNLHYRDMSKEQQQCIMASYKSAYLLKDFIVLGTINEDGDDVNPKSVELVNRAKLQLS